MVEEFALVKDFAIIMAVAGAITLLFRRMRQPPVLGYLIAGVLIGPYALPVPPVTDIHTVRLLADLGLVLLLFGLGLEFSWSKIRQIGLAVLIIGALVVLSILVALWFIPFISRLLLIGSVALTIPLLLLAFFLYILLRSFSHIHSQLERTFGRVLLGKEYISTYEAAQLLGVHQSTVVRWLGRMELPGLKIGRRWHIRRAELEALVETSGDEDEESIGAAEETDSGTDTGR